LSSLYLIPYPPFRLFNFNSPAGDLVTSFLRYNNNAVIITNYEIPWFDSLPAALDLSIDLTESLGFTGIPKCLKDQDSGSNPEGRKGANDSFIGHPRSPGSASETEAKVLFLFSPHINRVSLR
jgi:hypothetical protein